MDEIEFSIIIPAKNEESCIERTVQAALDSAKQYAIKISAAKQTPHQGVKQTPHKLPRFEIIVVDNLSSDGTPDIVRSMIESGDHHECLSVVDGLRPSSPCARNDGVQLSAGRVLVFIDADTVVPIEAIERIANHITRGKQAGISFYKSAEPGFRAWCWWTFWNYVRLLPISRAKAMPAFMFCTREVFDELGPFDETVKIGEEWPILAGLYRKRRQAFVYDRKLIVESSSRRMALQRFGYLRTLSKWVWAVLHKQGRINYRADIR